MQSKWVRRKFGPTRTREWLEKTKVLMLCLKMNLPCNYVSRCRLIVGESSNSKCSAVEMAGACRDWSRTARIEKEGWQVCITRVWGSGEGHLRAVCLSTLPTLIDLQPHTWSTYWPSDQRNWIPFTMNHLNDLNASCAANTCRNVITWARRGPLIGPLCKAW